MKFVYFYEQYLKEAAEDGDVMERIFAIALALYIAYGNINTDRVHFVRQNMNVDNSRYTIDTNITDNPNIQRMVGSGMDQEDSIRVVISLKLKKSAQKSFGQNYKTSNSVKNKLQVLLDKVVRSKSVAKINNFIESVLTNNKPDDIVFYVTADGMDAGNKKGEVKGDVKIKIEAKTNTPVPEDIVVPLSFSLKVTDDNSYPKFANSGIFDTMFQLAKSFRLPMVKGLEELDKFPKVNTAWQDQLDPIDYRTAESLSDIDGHFLQFIKNYFLIQSRFQSKDLSGLESDEVDEIRQESNQAEMQAAKSMYNSFLNEFSEQVNAMEDKKGFNDIVFDFLEKSVFGSDLSDVISISNNDIKEIEHGKFQSLRSTTDIDFAESGDDNRIMKFYDSLSNKLLFMIRPRIELPSGKRGSIKKEFAVEVGDLLYS